MLAAGWPTCLAGAVSALKSLLGSLPLADLLSFSMRSGRWTLGMCIYTSGARKRENWNEWLWLGVRPAPESPKGRGGRGVTMAG